MKKVDEREQQKSKNTKEHGLMEAVVKVKALYNQSMLWWSVDVYKYDTFYPFWNVP